MSKLIPPPPTLPPGSLVFAYLRDSGGDAQEQSVAQQEQVIREYAKDHGLGIVRIFKDVARSGGSEVGRDEFIALIESTEEKSARPAGLLLWNFARFARDFEDSSYYKSTLRKRGIVVHSVKDDIPAGRFGRVVEAFIDFSNEEKRHQTSDDVKRALASLVKAGYSCGGYPPRGYKAEPVIYGEKRNGQKRLVSKWVPDPELFPLVKLAWQLRAQGKGYAEITQATGGKLYKVRLSWHSFFENKTYLGIGKCGDLEVENHHEAAITYEIWEAVKRVEADQPRHGKAGGLAHPRRLAYPSLLSGLAHCIHCGAAMILHRDRVFTAYVCGTRDRERGIQKSCQNRQVNARKADTIILEAVLKQILTPGFVRDLISDIQAESRNTEKLNQEIEAAYKMLDLTGRSIRRLINLVQQTGEIDEVIDELKKRKAEQAEIKAHLADLETERNRPEIEITQEQLDQLLEAWREKIQQAHSDGDLLTAKRLISFFVKNVELGYNQARIHYTFPEINDDKEMPFWGHTSIMV